MSAHVTAIQLIRAVAIRGMTINPRESVHLFAILVASAFIASWRAPREALLRPTNAAEEITIYDANGAATAYIAADDDFTIYLWSGKPVAYLIPDREAYSIYGFNGRHLGWLENGIILDHEGDAVGFLKGAASILTQLEPLKSLKQLKPLKSLRELAPLKPVYSLHFAKQPLAALLAAGAD